MRYKWVDVYRGAAVLFMLILHFFVNIFPSQPINFLNYSERGVISIGDMDVAMFLFISGVSTYLMVAGKKDEAVKGAFARYLKIFLIGFLLDVILVITSGYIWWVLEAIGLSGIIALCFICFPNKMKVLAIIIIAVCYSYFVSIPSIYSAASLFPNGGFIGSFSLSTIVLFGYMSEEEFLKKKNSSSLMRWGMLLMAAGAVLASFITYDRNIATPPFIFLSSGFCMLLMVFVHWLVEVRGITLKFLEDFGRSALLVFILNYPVLILAVNSGVYQTLSVEEAALVSSFLILLLALISKYQKFM
ncbi:MAG: heparan-alpha-glucosaminide N-acetyltransferase domain-containing protein [Candidatus Micrarchaeia archaeon]